MSAAERVRSPCVSICALNEDDVCLGCHRSVEEIAGWARMDDDERRAVLKKVAEREAKYLIHG